MRFDFEGKVYQITFTRDRLPAPDHLQPSDADAAPVLRKYPNTTVVLAVGRIEEGKFVKEALYREATVGCWHREKRFNKRKGMARALRSLLPTIPKAMIPVLWHTFNRRGQ